MQKKKHIVILGPTGIGKSKLSLTFQTPGTEIISADAFQVYKDFNIGTAKVTKEEQSLIPHHFIDTKTASENYSAFEFCKNTELLLRKTDKHYIIVGGTALYLHAFVYQYNFDNSPSSQQNTQQYWRQIAEQKGVAFLWELIKKIDSELAKNTPKTNTNRLIRALEMYELSGKKPSLFQNNTHKIRKDIQLLGLTCSREYLYKRIDHRVKKMIKDGWIEEVRHLKTRYPVDANAYNAIGYREILSYLDNAMNKKELIECIQKKTRHFAKRQLTWFKQFYPVEWIHIDPQ